MFAVVGCNECSALWVVEGRPDTTSCPRCGKRHQYTKLKRFAETTTADSAKEARSRMLQGRSDADIEVEDFVTLERDAMASGMSDEEFLTASGLDADEVAAAGERAESSGRSRSRRDVVLDAIDEQDRPTESEIREYAAAHGVDTDYVDRALQKLRQRGEVSESGGRYRLV
ncbi:DUF5817 domain-containing protein [Halorarius litoreus]|uniref:DUF5817 domain-containing protein n=1 Tax=Halorarius litoreus TaxID=2962676 RepID=UPI0020CF94C8|nr:DUF5817 domain-containing protein [Halorarius litoreus]